MVNYLIRRVFALLLVLLLSSAAIYVILDAAPGSPLAQWRQFLISQGTSPTAEEIALYRHQLGLDKPAYLRFMIWLAGDDWIESLPLWFTGLDAWGNPFTNGTHKGILRGDWGRSWAVSRGRPVLLIIRDRFANTTSLMTCALILSLLVAIPVGIYSALRQYSTIDYAATTFSFIGISTPVFWLGLMLIILFSLKFREWGLPYLPSGGVTSLRPVPGFPPPGSFGDRVLHLVLPVITLSLIYMATWSRFMRASMLEVLGLDFIRAARAKGLRERLVVTRHALRNALIPLITIITIQLPGLFGGAVITETVFAYPGMGSLFFLGLGRSDWPVVMGYLVILSILVVTANLVADIAFVMADPRIRYS